MEEKGQLFFLLDFISQSDKPVGSGSACLALITTGHQVSEATCGRLLRELDERGFTEKQGFKGRIITSVGRNYLHTLTHEKNRLLFSQQLTKLVNSRNKEELLEILVARKAIEREIARLAALKINDEQLASLEISVTSYLNSDNNVEVGDLYFHNALTDAAGNRVLKAALNLIRQDAQLSPVLGYIRKKVHSKIFTDHLKIFNAVAGRNPVAAEQAMVEHIENLMADVHKYWSFAHIDEEANHS
ncbi:MAG: FCD domain-containing protein [Dethiobacter sp.]|jgi:GntR family L-lactate dehydrogenase operon transcriptional regulator|nr:FCD domain-containing protein [Dethiobacter sp.]